MQLEESFSIDINVGSVSDIGAGPFGHRRFISAGSGRISGEHLNATLVSGGDWVLETGNGFATADIRYVFQTDDGAFIYIQGKGLIELNPATGAALTGQGTTEYEDHYIRTNFTLETGDSRYAWVNTGVFVAETKFNDGPSLHYAVSLLA